MAHVARLARLHLDEATIDSYRTQLASVLSHIARLGQVDTVEQVLMNAPAREGDFIAVPKVLGGESA